MATLNLQLGSFELTPLERRPNDRKWMTCRVVLSLPIGTQCVVIENVELVFLEDADFTRLFKYIELAVHHIAKESAANSFPSLAPEVGILSITFVPLQLAFAFACLSGEVDKSLCEGEITIRIMVNLNELTNLPPPSTYIGGEFNVDVRDLLVFVADLRHELSIMDDKV
jgi:hypothetical protein